MKMNPIILLGAFNAEVDSFKNHLVNGQTVLWNEYEFWLGGLFGKNVVISKSGVGKVHAALLTQKLIDSYNPSLLLFTGLAGSLNERIAIGDIVVSKDLIQHDFIAHPQYPKYTIPRFNRSDTYHIFEADLRLREIALSYKPKNHYVFDGRILTGDQFLTRSELQDYRYLIEDLEGDAVEMEGAAVAQVCTINQVPFLVIRTISDRANKDASINFDEFLPIAAKNSLGIVEHIFKHL